MTLSRREFLQSVGLSATGAGLFGITLPNSTTTNIATAQPAAPPQILHGRVLRPGQVENLRTSQAVRSLLPDEVIPIHAENALFYGTDGGSVLREYIQPIQPYTIETTSPDDQSAQFVERDAEVAAPATTIHTYAAPNAPLTSRLGHGAVMHITDSIENQYGRWYNVQDADRIHRGWSQASHWRILATPTRRNSAHIHHLHLDRGTHQLTAYAAEQPVFRTLVRVPQQLTAGDFTLKPIGHISRPETINGQPQDAPYRFQLRSNAGTGDTYAAHAIHWHNDFHLPTEQANYTPTNIEFNILAGKWLYTWTADNTPFTIT